MGYWTYYLLWCFLAYASHYPGLVVGAVVMYLLRGFVPDPWVWLATAARMRSLKAHIAANPSHVTARRDLAVLYLKRLRPRAALALLDEARAKDPGDAELLYLTGLARLRSGDAEGALEPLVQAVDKNPKLLYGEPYRVAADALIARGRMEEAEDALARYLKLSSSSIEGWVKLARVRSKQGREAEAREALREAHLTFRQIPAFKRRKELSWWLASLATRLFI
jgi:predicted Zn-dependent protease